MWDLLLVMFFFKLVFLILSILGDIVIRSYWVSKEVCQGGCGNDNEGRQRQKKDWMTMMMENLSTLLLTSFTLLFPSYLVIPWSAAGGSHQKLSDLSET